MKTHHARTHRQPLFGLSDHLLEGLARKSVEPIALAADVSVRTLLEFLAQHRWQEDLARDRLQQIVAEEHAHPHSVGITPRQPSVSR